ncbi:trehalase-like [Watersipora subatra]|uniref:trehalase-like n=1 Tax=Watersipora subatra TaxID=2589382 RepID=UPI00355BA8EA
MPSLSEWHMWCELLDDVQTSGIYSDSKTFVDKPLKLPKAEVLKRFQGVLASGTADLKSFIDECFDGEGQELICCTPEGFTSSPGFLKKIKDKKLQDFARDLNAKWGELGRKMKPEVKEFPERYSLLHVPEPFVVPGGRFREFYYWDTYWAVQGMLLCELNSAVKSMLLNLIHLVNEYGFVPNGGRKYYLNRSQPPMLIPMVASYLSCTDDLPFLLENIAALEKEYEFWEVNRRVSVKLGGQSVDYFQYRVDTDRPRDESYKEDMDLAASQPTENRAKLFSDLASAAESGWDFSSRWYDPEKSSALSSIATRNVVPVDLNAFLCWNTRLLMEFHQRLGNKSRASYYGEKYLEMLQHLEQLFWDESKGAWFDFHLNTGKRDTRFFASMIAPVFTGCHGGTQEEQERKVQKLLNYLKNEEPSVGSLECGIPTSLCESKQQWDYPNAWPPLQHMWVRAFQKSSNPVAQKFAYQLASKWVRCNWSAWQLNNYMFEKYDAVNGKAGQGGEYEVQVGFGWSNGVILDFLNLYPDMVLDDPEMTLSWL